MAEHTHRVLNGRIATALAPLLDGKHSMADIIEATKGTLNPFEVFTMIHQLKSRGVVVDSAENMPATEAAFWEAVDSGAEQAIKAFDTFSADVHTIGNCDATQLLTALQANNININPDNASLQIYITDDYLHEAFDEINRKAIPSKQPWLIAKLVGNTVWIGPLFEPENTACWECLAQRLRGNRQVEAYILRKQQRQDPIITARSALFATVNTAANIVATEVAKWGVLTENPLLHNRMVTYDAINGEFERHILTQRPQCPACGIPAPRPAQPIQLQSNKKRHTSDGGHRVLLPEETLQRTERHISPITGIISSLTNVIQDGGILHSYVAAHNFPIANDNMSMLQANLTKRSGGKGVSDTQARVSATSEAIERYSGVFRGDDEPVTRSTYHGLGEQAIHLHDCLLFSETQYDNPPTWTHGMQSFRNVVPNRFDENKELDWSPIWSLTEQKFKYIPTSYCYYGHPELKLFYSDANSNGCAAGNTLEEAILQGFFELVERDAVAIWWYNRVQRPAIDLGSFGLPYFQKLEAHYAKIKRQFWVLDITSDFDIPVFVAVSKRIDAYEDALIMGFGCHLDPQVALLRAITELNQRLPSVTEVAADGSPIYPGTDKDKTAWLKNATLSAETYLAPSPTLPARTKNNIPNIYHDDIKDDIEWCVEKARQIGLEVLVLDQTRTDIDMPVCKVIVPGLRHYLHRLGAGRLYTVPVKLGWVVNPIPEEQMNPHSVSLCF